MADMCKVLDECSDLDGRLLLQRTVYGPQFGFDPQPATGGAGAGLRPYADLTFGLRWRSVGLCQGPATSVMGLAPGEVVTVGIRTRHSRSFSSLVRDAAEASRTSSHTDRHVRQRGTQPAAGGGSGGGGGGGIDGEDILGAVVSLAPVIIGAFGSFLGDALSVVGGVAGGIIGGPVGGAIGAAAGGAIGGLIDNAIDGGGGGGGANSPVVETASVTDEIINTIGRSESESHLRESTVTTADESESTIRRVFGNPYLDRSLQLRFLPVFNQFEITTSLIRVIPGLVTHFAEPAAPAVRQQFSASLAAGAVRMATAELASQVRPVATGFHLIDQVGDSDGVRRPMVAMLRSLGSREDNEKGVLVERGLSWDRAEVRGHGIHVPVAAAENAVSAWNLKGKEAESLVNSMKRIDPARLDVIFKPRVRKISVFAGTHIEAVAGNCVLPSVGDEFKAIVPGATQFVRQIDE